MTQEEKSKIYSGLLFQFDKLSNQINSIKGESIELNENQQREIVKLQSKQSVLVQEMRKLMS